MTKRDKRLQRIRQNPKAVRFEELRTILEAFGIEEKRITGSHHIFAIQLGEDLHRLTIPFHSKQQFLKSIYVKQSLELIDLVIQFQGDDIKDETDE